jgi:hypothetical protein
MWEVKGCVAGSDGKRDLSVLPTVNRDKVHPLKFSLIIALTLLTPQEVLCSACLYTI